MAIKRRMHIVSNDEHHAILETGIKIAFASTDMKQVNQHFGAARALVLYGVDKDKTELLEAVQFTDPMQGENETKLAEKILLVADCAAIYCRAIGASAIQQLLKAGVQPVKVSEGAVIKDLLRDIQNELRSGPSAWLAKAIAKQKGSTIGRFGRMEIEGWTE